MKILVNNYSKLFVALMVMMIIFPNSRAHKGEKERGEVKGEYGGI